MSGSEIRLGMTVRRKTALDSAQGYGGDAQEGGDLLLGHALQESGVVSEQGFVSLFGAVQDEGGVEVHIIDQPVSCDLVEMFPQPLFP